ncbi:MAG TPA: hypothetical protein VF771_07590, partial [Longimicrobiaceae bacterium]
GRVTKGDTVRAVDEALPAGTLDHSVAATAVHALPFCEGAAFRFGGYDPAEGSMRDAVYHVLGAERVEIGGAMRDVWTAEVRVADRMVRMHVDRATGQELDWAMPGPGGAILRGVSRIPATR